MSGGKLISKLNELLANQMVVYVKLRNYHWNITGPQFYNIHNVTEEFYDQFADMVDEVAERIRQLDETPLSTMAGYLEYASFEEETSTSFTAEEVASRLLEDFRALHKDSKTIIVVTEEADDVATADLMSEQIDWLEETIWMLNAFIS